MGRGEIIVVPFLLLGIRKAPLCYVILVKKWIYYSSINT